MKKMIEVTNLSFGYKKDKLAVKNISFEVEQGEVFGFLGPNGSGKSTTQKIVTGVLRNFAGEVIVLGKKIKEWDEKLYNDVGVLYEFPYLYSNLNAIDNLKYFSSFYCRDRVWDIDELLKKVELKKDYLKKPVSSYSKGMKQRVNMARALVSTPKLLFLDEPTSGLDPAASVMFRDLIHQEKEKGTTIFLTTHNMFDADILCDRVAFISEGEIKAVDTPHNLKLKHSTKMINVEYLQNGQHKETELAFEVVGKGLPIDCDEILSIHSKEPTLEDVFIQMTGRSLD